MNGVDGRTDKKACKHSTCFLFNDPSLAQLRVSGVCETGVSLFYHCPLHNTLNVPLRYNTLNTRLLSIIRQKLLSCQIQVWCQNEGEACTSLPE